MCKKKNTPTLNQNHSCGERESERSTVYQNALRFGLCDINQLGFLPPPLSQSFGTICHEADFQKEHCYFSLYQASCRVSNSGENITVIVRCHLAEYCTGDLQAGATEVSSSCFLDCRFSSRLTDDICAKCSCPVLTMLC